MSTRDQDYSGATSVIECSGSWFHSSFFFCISRSHDAWVSLRLFIFKNQVIIGICKNCNRTGGHGKEKWGCNESSSVHRRHSSDHPNLRKLRSEWSNPGTRNATRRRLLNGRMNTKGAGRCQRFPLRSAHLESAFEFGDWCITNSGSYFGVVSMSGAVLPFFAALLGVSSRAEKDSGWVDKRSRVRLGADISKLDAWAGSITPQSIAPRNTRYFGYMAVMLRKYGEDVANFILPQQTRLWFEKVNPQSWSIMCLYW